MTSTTTSAKVPPGGGKASAGKTPITKKQIQILCGVAAGIALIVGVYFLWEKTRPRMPRMDAPTPVLARYILTSHYDNLPFDMQVQFWKERDSRNAKEKKELDKVFAEGRITETEYRAALQAAWFGKHLTRVEKYAAMAGTARQAYLDKNIISQLDEKEREKITPKPAKENDISGNPSATEERARIDKWPAEARERWYQYEKEYKARKKLIEQARAKTRPAVNK